MNVAIFVNGHSAMETVREGFRKHSAVRRGGGMAHEAPEDVVRGEHAQDAGDGGGPQ